jgi:uncharacterized membrane protein YgdD (TMEM256/DUF423 family)
VIGIFFGGIFTDALSGAIAVLIGIFGGSAHYYAAVLAGRTKRETERATAYVFFSALVSESSSW